MTVWYKQGVRGRLNPQARKCLGRIAKVYDSYGEDLFVTSVEEGNHGDGSLHYCGDAFDFRYSNAIAGPSHEEVKDAAGKDFDVVSEKTHIHVEYDPK
jgi:hypothetical protein